MDRQSINKFTMFTEKDINNFMAFLRATFPEPRILPGCTSWKSTSSHGLAGWHFGFGIMGEQGSEAYTQDDRGQL